MALNIDTAAVDSPELLAKCLDRSFKSLIRAGK